MSDSEREARHERGKAMAVADLRQEHGRFVISESCGENREKVRAVMTLLKSLAKPKETL